MPLSAPVPGRRPVHTREVVCNSFERDDGMWDIEGRLTDVKSYAFPNRHRGTIHAGEPLHDMRIRLTIDRSLKVHAVEAVSEAYPHAMCPAITPSFQALEGLVIGPGWNQAVRERLGGVRGCTHLVDLLRPMATVAIHTVRWSRSGDDLKAALDGTAPPRAEKPKTGGLRNAKPPLDTCHVWAADGPVVKEEFPEYYTGDTGERRRG